MDAMRGFEDSCNAELAAIHHRSSTVSVSNYPRRAVLFVSLATAMTAMAATAAAQDATSSSVNVGTVVVSGQAQQLNRALRQQEQSDRVESVAHADDIGQLPDENAAEALQRLSGVSVQRDQGEGRFVTVRGMAPDLNTVTINGATIPAPEAGRRAVAMDVLPSELVESLAVVKTLTPDMDANSLGATIEVETLTAFDRRKPLRTVTYEMGHNELVGQISPKVSGGFTHRFGGTPGKETVGLAIAASWQHRTLGSDNVESGGAWSFDGSGKAEGLEEFQQREYNIIRNRKGLGINLDFRPNAGGRYYIRTLATQFDDRESRDSMAYKFKKEMMPGDIGTIKAERALKARDQDQSMRSFVVGGNQQFGAWDLNGQISHSYADEKSVGSSGGTFAGTRDFTGFSFSGTDELLANLPAAILDPRNFNFSKVKWQESHHTDRINGGQLDLSRHFSSGNVEHEIKGGIKLSRRDKVSEADVWSFKKIGKFPINLTEYLTANPVDNRYGSFGNALDWKKLNAVFQQFATPANLSDEDSKIDDYRIRENIDAAYIMDRMVIGNWRIIGGVRREATRINSEGTGILDGDFSPLTISQRYTHILPNLQAIGKFGERTILRMGATKSVVRPTFEQISPNFVDDGEEEAVFGNPNLQPMTSVNLDFGIEHYFGDVGLISAHAFRKNLRNFTYLTDLAGTPGRWLNYDAAETFANGAKGHINGIELGYSTRFAGNFLFNANVTLTKSSGDILRDGSIETIRLPNQSDRVANVMVGWENEAISLRLAANHKSDYLFETHATDATSDVFADAQTFVDFTARYRVSPNAQLSFSANNLTDQTYYNYQYRRPYNAQLESYGRTYKLAITWNF